MKKVLTVLFFLYCSSAFAASNSNPGLYYGFVPTAGQWNSYFGAKLDFAPGSVNAVPYWDGSGNFLSASISGDCSSVANVFTCTATSGKTLFLPTAPTILSGFGTSPSIVSSNGTATFKINVGTGGTASSGIVAMPASTTGYNCTVTPAASPQAAAVMYSTATSATSITITNYTLATGVTLAWTASTIIAVHCVAF